MVLRKALCLALMFCITWRRASAIETSITFGPESLVLDHDAAGDGGNVNVTCKAIGVQDADYILSMWISRTTTTVVNKNLAKASSAGLEISISGMTATGSISDMKLTLTMPNVKCADAGNYTCGMFVDIPDSTPTTYDRTDGLHVEVSPGLVTLTATESKESYTVNETLAMLCNGPVGTVNDDTQVSWHWQYKDKDTTTWQTVLDSDGHIEDVGDPIEGECEEVRKSRLTRNLTLADSERMYRCVVERNNQEYPQFAGNYTIESVTEEVSTTTASTSGDTAGTANVSAIVGGLVGALVAIIVVIVIVVFVVRRRKSNQGDDYPPGDAGDKPADDPNGPPFTTTGPGVTYSAPKPYRNDREPRGVSNRGMDEATEKPSPRDNNTHLPRYANDFHQGRRNRGFSYDPDGRSGGQRYSSDEDGTDSRVNTSQVSIGHGDPSIGTPI